MEKGVLFLLLVLFIGGLYGCAGTIPSAEFKKPISDAYRLCADDEAEVKLIAAEGVALNDTNRQRLESRVKEAIAAKKKDARCKTNGKRSFVLDSRITRYDEGNAFARAMSAGLGQIHIDGDFSLLLLSASGNERVAEFTLQKTFAWGGLYGGMTRMEDIEATFAGGVAEAIVAPTPEKVGQAPTSQKIAQKAEE